MSNKRICALIINIAGTIVLLVGVCVCSPYNGPCRPMYSTIYPTLEGLGWINPIILTLFMTSTRQQAMKYVQRWYERSFTFIPWSFHIVRSKMGKKNLQWLVRRDQWSYSIVKNKCNEKEAIGNYHGIIDGNS